MKDRFSGKFIVLDGPDGCGKSTQCNLLTSWIEKKGVKVVSYRDPGTTVVGEKIRGILLDIENENINTRTELLLYMAARSQLWCEKILPSLQSGRCVILDRWLSSTCAYQGFAGGFGMEKIINIAKDSLERVWPDITVILDIDLKAAVERMTGQLDRMEQKGDSYHEKVRLGFLELAKDREGFAIVNASDDIETIHGNITALVKKMLI